MTQHKVLSDDSMTAMDEIARVLGQDAVILSTKKIGEKIEIIGSNDIKDILKSNKKNSKKPNFQELFSKVPLSKNHTNININPNVKNDSHDKSAINQKFVSKIDLENFKHEIKDTDWRKIDEHESANDKYNIFEEKYTGVYESCFRIKTK